ncbi:hypothetical protein CR203_17765 [Salipaludibacillus neizhouensis]|uniref:Type 4 fimbrial biogenesis protein PilX N-terminal domain-containing protein n=1 Tax=Salipaludibacillus neizhouensis TaxID=885475 RepID=A0A3A9K4Y4_9BACI|nr:PilX N-terminal domain-containing pilus assembly protein [Salipaludibacillus neizhouensis]RKL65920.1 hypothetical protein CR203_17765 [Salipaludibacillus neizhouensis]
MIHKFLSTKKLNNENGMALVLVLLLVMIFSVLTLGVIGVTSSNLTLTTGERDHQSSYYIAEAGINVRMQEIEEAIIKAYKETNSKNAFFLQFEDSISLDDFISVNNFEKLETISDTIVSRIEQEDNTHTYSIYSKGTIDNRSREVTKDITINWIEKDQGSTVEFLDDVAVFSNQSIYTSIPIQGSIATNSNAEKTIELDWGSSVSGNILVGTGVSDINGSIKKPSNYNLDYSKVGNIPREMVYDLPPFPTYPEALPKASNLQLDDNGNNHHLVINDGSLLITSYVANNYEFVLDQDFYIPEIKINSNRNVTIDIGDSNKVIVVDHLNIPNGHLNIKGNGSLKMYITAGITMGSGSTINNNGNSDQLQLFLQSSNNPSQPKSLTLGGAQKIFASFYGEDTNISLSGGGGFQGNILTGGTSINISGGSDNKTRVFYAPNAHFSMGGGGALKGRIISNSFDASGGSQVTFEEIENESLLPFFPPSQGEEIVNIDKLIIDTSPIREQ